MKIKKKKNLYCIIDPYLFLLEKPLKTTSKNDITL